MSAGVRETERESQSSEFGDFFCEEAFSTFASMRRRSTACFFTSASLDIRSVSILSPSWQRLAPSTTCVLATQQFNSQHLASDGAAKYTIRTATGFRHPCSTNPLDNC